MVIWAGVDLGGTTLSAVLLENDRRVADATVPTGDHAKPEVILDHMAGIVHRLETKVGERAKAVGVGAPGQVDYGRGVFLKSPPILPTWKNVPMGRELRKRLQRDVWVDNDANVALLGEAQIGAAEGARNAVLFSLGTGVGGAAMVDGHILRGADGGAGEFGHIQVVANGPACNCGGRGCLGVTANATALIRYYRKAKGPKVETAEEVGAALRRGDARARKACAELAVHLAKAVEAVACAVSPELVLLSGGVAQLGAPLSSAVRKAIRRPYPTALAKLKIKRARLGRLAGAMGAACLAREAWSAQQ